MNNAGKIAPFVSGHSLSRLLMLLLVVALAVSAVGIVMTYQQTGPISKLDAGKSVPQKEINANMERQQTFNLISLPLMLLMGIVFLVWVHRVYKNLAALGARDLKHSPASAVVYFLIPIMQLYRPFFIMREVFKASDPGIDASDGSSWKKAAVPPTVVLWWLCYAVGLFIYYAYFTVAFVLIARIEAGTLLNMLYAAMFAGLLQLVSTVFLIMMVKSIDHRQEEKSRRLGLVSAPPGGVTLKGAGA